MIDDVEGEELLEDSQEFTDDSLMPFGKYKNMPLDSVPPDYLLWWFDQDTYSIQYPGLVKYIEDRYNELTELSEIEFNEKHNQCPKK